MAFINKFFKKNILLILSDYFHIIQSKYDVYDYYSCESEERKYFTYLLKYKKKDLEENVHSFIEELINTTNSNISSNEKKCSFEKIDDNLSVLVLNYRANFLFYPVFHSEDLKIDSNCIMLTDKINVFRKRNSFNEHLEAYLIRPVLEFIKELEHSSEQGMSRKITILKKMLKDLSVKIKNKVLDISFNITSDEVGLVNILTDGSFDIVNAHAKWKGLKDHIINLGFTVSYERDKKKTWPYVYTITMSLQLNEDIPSMISFYENLLQNKEFNSDLISVLDEKYKNNPIKIDTTNEPKIIHTNENQGWVSGEKSRK